MHDLIKEMGMNIVSRMDPQDPKKHSRLWIRNEIEDLLSGDSVSEATEYIQLEPVELSFEVVMNGLGNLKNLRALRFSEKVIGGKNLLDLNCLTAKSQNFGKVEEKYNGRLFLSHDQFYSKLLKRLDLKITPKLERLDLKRCIDLIEVHSPVGSLRSLGMGKLWMIFKKYDMVFDMFMAQRRLRNGMRYGFVRYKSASDVEGLLSQLRKIKIGEELLRVYVAYDRKRNNRNVGGRDAGEWDNSRYNCNINMRGQRYENVGNDRRGKRSYVDVVNGGYKRGGDGSKNKMVNEDNGYKEKVKEGLEKQWARGNLLSSKVDADKQEI
ncbi:transposon TX1 [Tanacetum coccineum]|uniref:Transposon TX1 n=1 Tax=Tanacetum coccineum TaxID=301880 RepID=A0ABQ5HRK4_9ASTR